MTRADSTDRFSLVVGGAFHTLLHRIGLIGLDQLPTRRAAVGLVLLAWLPPALLAIGQAATDSRYPGWSFFTDSTVYTRYVLAIWVMIRTEHYAKGRVTLITRQFSEARLLSPAAEPGFASALAVASRRSSSVLVELVILVTAIVVSGLSTQHAVALAGSSWEGTVVAGEVVLSWAGHVARLVSTPLFLFLVLRWIWRFLVWAVLLYRISRLPLQLTPLHPDRAGGLGFLAISVNAFSGFVFALSSVVASSMLKGLPLAQHSPKIVWFALGGWLAMTLIVFLGPLLVFVGPLHALRERALLDYGRLANQHHLAFQRKWVGDARSGADLMGSSEPSSAADLNAIVDVVGELRVIPLDVIAVAQLVVAAGAPLLAVVATQMPLSDLARWIVEAIL